MAWKIKFYSDKIEKNILEWPEDVLAKFLWISDIMGKIGPNELGMPHIKPLKQGLMAEVKEDG